MSVWVAVLSWLCLGLGAVFCVVGGIGLLRLPDVYARTHAATITDTMGAGLILLGLMLQAGPTMIAVKLLMVLVFLLATSPVASHALVKAAYGEGVTAEVDTEGVDQVEPDTRREDAVAGGGPASSAGPAPGEHTEPAAPEKPVDDPQ